MKSKAIEKIKVLADSMVPAEEKAKAALDPDAPSWIGHVAVLTGVLAALGGFLTVRSTILTNDAIYESNQAILAQTDASDAWSEYQADSIKARIIEVQLLASSKISAKDREQLDRDDKELRDRQPKSKQQALDKTALRETHLNKGLKRLGQKDLLGYAGMAAQLGIALASIAAITRRRMAFYAGIALGVISIVMTAYTMIESYLAG